MTHKIANIFVGQVRGGEGSHTYIVDEEALPQLRALEHTRALLDVHQVYIDKMRKYESIGYRDDFEKNIRSERRLGGELADLFNKLGVSEFTIINGVLLQYPTHVSHLGPDKEVRLEECPKYTTHPLPTQLFEAFKEGLEAKFNK